jgi:DNA-binding response OmpR family regulator
VVYRKAKLLIVDDELSICDVLDNELTEQGYICETALNGDDALMQLTKHEFDLALVDIKLPGMSGIELLKRIHSCGYDIATIVITAVNDPETVLEVMKLGVSDYVIKPFRLDAVNASVHSALDRKQGLDKSRGCQIRLGTGGEREDGLAVEKSVDEMDVIAFGVEAKQDLLDGHSVRVTRRTVEIARQLGISADKIEKWAARRARLYAERDRVIKSSMGKLEQSPLAQSIMGVAVPYISEISPSDLN